MLFLVFLYDTRVYRSILVNVRDTSAFNFIFYSLFVLSILSIFGGYFLEDLFIGCGNFFSITSGVIESCYFYVSRETVGILTKWFFFMFCGLFSYEVYVYFLNEDVKVRWFIYNNIFLLEFFRYKWNFNLIYRVFGNVIMYEYIYSYVFKNLDRGVFESVGSQGIIRSFNFFSNLVLSHYFNKMSYFFFINVFFNAILCVYYFGFF